jgi:hypothetical protein
MSISICFSKEGERKRKKKKRQPDKDKHIVDKPLDEYIASLLSIFQPIETAKLIPEDTIRSLEIYIYIGGTIGSHFLYPINVHCR